MAMLSFSTKLTFGKYKGKSVWDVFQKDKGYITWLSSTWKGETHHKLKLALDGTSLVKVGKKIGGVTYPIVSEVLVKKVKIDKSIPAYFYKFPNSGVYLLQVVYADKTLLKIGKSENCLERFKTHKSSNPDIQFICFIQTEDLSLETQLHNKYQEFRYSNEWFIYDYSIVDYFQTTSKLNNKLANDSLDTFLEFKAPVFKPTLQYYYEDIYHSSSIVDNHRVGDGIYKYRGIIKRNINDSTDYGGVYEVSELYSSLIDENNRIPPYYQIFRTNRYEIASELIDRFKYNSYDTLEDRSKRNVKKETYKVSSLDPTLRELIETTYPNINIPAYIKPIVSLNMFGQ
jgi:hypothetical protein